MASTHTRILPALLLGTALLVAGCASRSLSSASGSKIHVMYEFTKPDSAKQALQVNVYRADVSTGPFKKLNPKPIKVPTGEPGALATLYTDRTVANGRDYFYYITEVREGGSEVKIVPVTRAQAVLRTTSNDKGTDL